MDGDASAPGKLLENGDRLPQFLDLVLCIPAFLAEPDQSLSKIGHSKYPPR